MASAPNMRVAPGVPTSGTASPAPTEIGDFVSRILGGMSLAVPMPPTPTPGDAAEAPSQDATQSSPDGETDAAAAVAPDTQAFETLLPLMQAQGDYPIVVTIPAATTDAPAPADAAAVTRGTATLRPPVIVSTGPTSTPTAQPPVIAAAASVSPTVAAPAAKPVSTPGADAGAKPAAATIGEPVLKPVDGKDPYPATPAKVAPQPAAAAPPRVNELAKARQTTKPATEPTAQPKEAAPAAPISPAAPATIAPAAQPLPNPPSARAAPASPDVPAAPAVSAAPAVPAGPAKSAKPAEPDAPVVRIAPPTVAFAVTEVPALPTEEPVSNEAASPLEAALRGAVVIPDLAARPTPRGRAADRPAPIAQPEISPPALPAHQADIAGPDVQPERPASATAATPTTQNAAPWAPSAAAPSRVAETAPARIEMPDQSVERALDLAHDSEWLDRLARDISAAGDRDGTLRFRLHPQSLGHMRVELSQGDHGTSIRLSVETEAARAILVDAQPRLAAEARAQGVRIAETDVQLSGSDQQPSSDPRRQEEARQGPTIRTAAAARDDDGAARPGRSTSDRFA